MSPTRPEPICNETARQTAEPRPSLPVRAFFSGKPIIAPLDNRANVAFDSQNLQEQGDAVEGRGALTTARRYPCVVAAGPPQMAAALCDEPACPACGVERQHDPSRLRHHHRRVTLGWHRTRPVPAVVVICRKCKVLRKSHTRSQVPFLITHGRHNAGDKRVGNGRQASLPPTSNDTHPTKCLNTTPGRVLPDPIPTQHALHA